MKSSRSYHFSYFFLCLIFWQTSLLAQDTTPVSNSENISGENTRTAQNLIHYGDLIDVDVIGSIEYDWRGTINPEGFLNGIDFIEEPVYALCRTEKEVAADLEKAYAKILRDPKVRVRILDRSNRPLAFINGAVKTPQKFQIKRAVFLNELLIISGGLTERSSGEIQVFRPKSLNCPGKADTEGSVGESTKRLISDRQDNGSTAFNIKISDLLSGRQEANPQILSGDIITVLEADSIYVIGVAAAPKQISTRGQMTLTRAVDSAGGLSKDADIRNITVFRRVGGEAKVIQADLEKIRNGQSEDVILQPFDIVDVPQSGRERRKFPPIVRVADVNRNNPSSLPLQIID